MPTTIDQLVEDIKSLKVQSATTIANRSVQAIISQVKLTRSLDQLPSYALKLARARPNEPMTANVMKYLLAFEELSVGEFLHQARLLLHRLNDVDRNITEAGVALIKSRQVIFTHCHSSKVEHLLVSAHRRGRRFSVYVDETRPLFQGHITVKNLVRNGLDVTLTVDGLSSYIISRRDARPVDLILLGADVIARDGSVVNKVGSYGIALSAYQAQIPLYIVSSILKYDPASIRANRVPIEVREPAEIWPHPPRGLKILSPAFDAVPAEYITGLVTEVGIIPPKKVKNLALKQYPFIRHNLPS